MVDEYLAGRIDLPHYRGRSCYSFAVQAAERAVREARRAARRSTTSSSSSPTARDRASACDAGAVYEVDVHAEPGALDPPDVLVGARSAARGATPQESFANEPSDEHEPALVVELAGQLGGA